MVPSRIARICMYRERTGSVERVKRYQVMRFRVLLMPLLVKNIKDVNAIHVLFFWCKLLSVRMCRDTVYS